MEKPKPNTASQPGPSRVVSQSPSPARREGSARSGASGRVSSSISCPPPMVASSSISRASLPARSSPRPSLGAEAGRSGEAEGVPVAPLESSAHLDANGAAGTAIPVKARRKSRQRHRPETRTQMLERLSNPLISLHEASVLLRLCAATVRRLANEGELPHERTEGGQRRFRLRDVMRVLEEREARRRLSSRPVARASTHSSPSANRVMRPVPERPFSSAPQAPATAGSAPSRVGASPSRDPRELLAATHARAQAARMAAQRASGESTPGTPTKPASTAAAPGSPSALRLGLARARTLGEAGHEPAENNPARSQEHEEKRFDEGRAKGRG